jgi:hypothetical protein
MVTQFGMPLISTNYGTVVQLNNLLLDNNLRGEGFNNPSPILRSRLVNYSYWGGIFDGDKSLGGHR